MAKVAILMGSSSDLSLMQPGAEVLAELGISVEVRVMSAHRTPERVVEFVRASEAADTRVFICGAGAAAHLAGVVCSQTVLPVIGVPLARTPLGGADALYSTVQMPAGMPVATVAIDGGQNAGLLAAAILAVSDPAIADRLRKRRVASMEKVAAQDAEVRAKASRP
jgi:5-(carboxyamino)imidazole ribonucleotide mutase